MIMSDRAHVIRIQLVSLTEEGNSDDTIDEFASQPLPSQTAEQIFRALEMKYRCPAAKIKK